MAEAKKPSEDVPAELEQSKKNKDAAAQKAQEALDNSVSSGEKMLVALGYVSFLCILPLVLLRESKFAQFHGKQALVLAIVIYFLDIVQIMPAVFASLYTVTKTIVVVYAIYSSFQGKYFRIPFIYSMSERIQINITSAEKAQ